MNGICVVASNHRKFVRNGTQHQSNKIELLFETGDGINVKAANLPLPSSIFLLFAFALGSVLLRFLYQVKSNGALQKSYQSS